MGPVSGDCGAGSGAAPALSFLPPPPPRISYGGVAMSESRAPRGVPAAPGCLLLLGLLLVGAAAAECELEAADVPSGRRGARGGTAASSSSSSAAEITGNGSARKGERAPVPRCPPCLPASVRRGAERRHCGSAPPWPELPQDAGRILPHNDTAFPAELGEGLAGLGCGAPGATPPGGRPSGCGHRCGFSRAPSSGKEKCGKLLSTDNFIYLFLRKNGSVPIAVLVANGNACTQSAVAVEH